MWADSVVLRIDEGLGMLVGRASADKADDADADGSDGDDSDADMGDESKDESKKSKSASTWGETGYVHISRAADTHTDHLARKFKVGQQIPCRIVGASTARSCRWAALVKRDAPSLG